ncbi:MAG: nucleotide exchange factor GrpE [Synergistaceae bacterium]|nr:nucleotide exchange factor GrpE [Synergistaceae bacterium]
MKKQHETKKENIAHTDENEVMQEPVVSEQNGTEIQKTEHEEKILELQSELALERADYYNYRQRAEKEKTRLRALISESRVLDFIPVLDNLDRALSVPEDSTALDVLKGVKMVQRQFLSVLQELGVEVIVSIKNGELFEFDPLLHDAVGTEEVTDPDLDGKVVEELLKGYRTKERVLRPAQVKVGKLTEISTKE